MKGDKTCLQEMEAAHWARDPRPVVEWENAIRPRRILPNPRSLEGTSLLAGVVAYGMPPVAYLGAGTANE
jgi:hypothetical protein